MKIQAGIYTTTEYFYKRGIPYRHACHYENYIQMYSIQRYRY